MRYKIAICDDSEADRQFVGNIVSRWAADAGHTVQTDTFSSAESFLFHYEDERDYDILLLDIEMGALDGVSMAKQLDERFYRVGRSAIINLTQVSRVTKTEIRLNDGTAVMLPRGAYDGVNHAIIDMR